MPIDMKNMIAKTLSQMVKTKNVDKITVKALIEECHVSRQTFYYHFQDLMDVFEYSVRKITDELIEKTLEMDDPNKAIEMFIDGAVESYPLLSKLMASSRREQIEKMMIQALQTYLKEIVRRKAPELSISYADLNFKIEFFSYGMTGVLLANCGKPNLDKKKLAEQISQLL